METTANPIDVVISFDTTGSMYPVLTQVRRKVKAAVERLMNELPGIHIGIIAHGDYCDAGSTYVTQHLDLTQEASSITDFVEHTAATGGGDAPECYELVLHEAQELAWRPDATRVFVMIGDDVPMLRRPIRSISTGARKLRPLPLRVSASMPCRRSIVVMQRHFIKNWRTLQADFI